MTTNLTEKMAGEIALSNDPGKTMRKWREEFSVSQNELASAMDVSPSVISDYESGRRRSPGVGVVKKMVDSLMAIDAERGSPTASKFKSESREECIIAMEEFGSGIPPEEFVKALNGTILNPGAAGRMIYGYTVVNSMKAIMSLSSSDYLKIYGWSTERALIFTDVSFGRSPMVAIRAHPLTPAMVVYLKPEKIDPLAVKLAELEGVPLVSVDTELNELIMRLRALKEGK
ncbi:MAG: helix-turn-helix domain-containing protein [Methanomassiliicoccaceae archaeon]|jgi:putative transcriptional regulator|nr:helix-turn-helix domain-containing protein [Methanomassiliicoccaceae archaeon]